MSRTENVSTSRISIPSRWLKNCLGCFVTFHADRKRIGKINRVRSRKIIESPSAPRVSARLYSGIKWSLVINWNPKSDLLKARQERTPASRAHKEVTRAITRSAPCDAAETERDRTKPTSKISRISANGCSSINILRAPSSVDR